MKLKYRFYVLLSSYTWAIIGLFLTGSLFFFVLPVAAIIYIFMGGKKHVWDHDCYLLLCVLYWIIRYLSLNAFKTLYRSMGKARRKRFVIFVICSRICWISLKDQEKLSTWKSLFLSFDFLFCNDVYRFNLYSLYAFGA